MNGERKRKTSDVPAGAVETQGQGLSPGLRKLLEKHGVEGELDAAVDAALEEGIPVTREEASEILKIRKEKNPDK